MRIATYVGRTLFSVSRSMKLPPSREGRPKHCAPSESEHDGVQMACFTNALLFGSAFVKYLLEKM